MKIQKFFTPALLSALLLSGAAYAEIKGPVAKSPKTHSDRVLHKSEKVDEAHAAVDAAHAKVAEIEGKKAALDEEIAELTALLEEARHKASSTKIDVVKKTAAFQEAELKSAIDGLNAAYHAELDAANKARVEAEVAAAKAEKRKKAAESVLVETLSLTHALQDANTSVADKEQAIAQLKAEMDKIKEQLSSVESELAKANEVNSKLTAEKAISDGKLKEALATVGNLSSAVHFNLNELESKLKGLDTAVAAKNKMIGKLRKLHSTGSMSSH
jgi:chromosome segregation ATPase